MASAGDCSPVCKINTTASERSSALALKSHLTESDASAVITRAVSGTSAADAGG